MKHWFRALRAWLKWQPLPHKDLVSWEQGDADSLKAFFCTPAGQRFLIRMNAMRDHLVHHAVLDRKANSCEYALGFASATAWIVSLSGNVTPQADVNEDENKDAISRLEGWASNN